MQSVLESLRLELWSRAEEGGTSDGSDDEEDGEENVLWNDRAALRLYFAPRRLWPMDGILLFPRKGVKKPSFSLRTNIDFF